MQVKHAISSLCVPFEDLIINSTRLIDISVLSPFSKKKFSRTIDPVSVNLSLRLLKVMDINERENTIDLKFEVIMEWRDCRITYNNLKEVSKNGGAEGQPPLAKKTICTRLRLRVCMQFFASHYYVEFALGSYIQGRIQYTCFPNILFSTQIITSPSTVI